MACRLFGSHGSLGVPIKNRIAGSDIFDALKAGHSSAKPLKVFLFGGAEGVAAAACRALNAQAERALLRWIALSWFRLCR